MRAHGGRLAAVELVDAHLCSDGGKFLAALLLSLASMLHLELPHINVLSKADLVEAYGQLHFNLDFYTEVQRAHHCMNDLYCTPVLNFPGVGADTLCIGPICPLCNDAIKLILRRQYHQLKSCGCL